MHCIKRKQPSQLPLISALYLCRGAKDYLLSTSIWAFHGRSEEIHITVLPPLLPAGVCCAFSVNFHFLNLAFENRRLKVFCNSCCSKNSSEDLSLRADGAPLSLQLCVHFCLCPVKYLLCSPAGRLPQTW